MVKQGKGSRKAVFFSGKIKCNVDYTIKIKKGAVAVSIKEQKFCDELLSDPDFNKTLAYKKAYPSVKNDNVAAATRMLPRLMNSRRLKST